MILRSMWNWHGTRMRSSIKPPRRR